MAKWTIKRSVTNYVMRLDIRIFGKLRDSANIRWESKTDTITLESKDYPARLMQHLLTIRANVVRPFHAVYLFSI